MRPERRVTVCGSAALCGMVLLSGLPLALTPLALTGPWYDWPNPQLWSVSALDADVSLAALLETGHLLSPIALAWSHKGFRRVMLERKGKFILLLGKCSSPRSRSGRQRASV